MLDHPLSAMRKRLILGPQRPVRNLGEAVGRAGFRPGTIGVISAGWQEAEGDIEDVRELIGRPLVDLRLYRRAESLFASDAPLHSAYRERQEQLKELQRLYRLRLRPLMGAARELLRADGEPGMLAPEQRHAVSQLRSLDRHHLQRVEAIHAAFHDEYGVESYEPLAAQAEAIAESLAGVETLLITGGNVVVLHNRMRLFGIERLLPEKDLIAWSAGAMVLGRRIVLYHDRMPQRRRDPELFARGAGVVPGQVFLPDASHRLRLNDKIHVGLFCRRFAPDIGVTLDSGAEMLFEGGGLTAADSARQMGRDGRLTRMRSA